MVWFILGLFIGNGFSEPKSYNYESEQILACVLAVIFGLSFVGAMIFNIVCWIKEKKGA